MKKNVRVMCSIEGPDMCGKSEIARELANQLSAAYFKNSGEWGPDLRSSDYFENLLLYGGTLMTDLLCQIRPHVVLDRYYPSEFVYSSVFGRKTNMQVLEKIDRSFAAAGGKHVICRRKSYEGINDDLHSYVDSEMLRQLDVKYSDFTDWTKCPVMTLWVDDENLGREINEILAWI